MTGVYAFITLKDHVTEPTDQIVQELKATVRQKIAAYAVPEIIQVGSCEPRQNVYNTKKPRALAEDA